MGSNEWKQWTRMPVKNEPSGGYVSAKREDQQGGDKKRRRSRSGAGLWKKETKGMAMGEARDK